MRLDNLSSKTPLGDFTYKIPYTWSNTKSLFAFILLTIVGVAVTFGILGGLICLAVNGLDLGTYLGTGDINFGQAVGIPIALYVIAYWFTLGQ